MDGLLPPDATAGLRDHVDKCRECQSFREDLVLVGGFGDQLVQALLAVRLSAVTQLAAMGAQTGTQLALLIVQKIRGLGLAHTETNERLAGGCFCNVTGLHHGGFQRAAQGFVEGLAMCGWGHQKVTGP